MNSSSIRLAKSLHHRLATDQSLLEILGNPPRLYDQAPEDPLFPYLTYGAMREEDIGGDVAPVMQQTLSLHIWSRYAGRAETLSLLALVSSIIQSSPLSLHGDSGKFRSYILFTDVMPTTDRLGYHGILRVRFVEDKNVELAA